MSKKIIIYGAGGHAESCISLIEKNEEFEIIGLIGLKSEIGKQVLDYSVIGSDDDISEAMKLSNKVIIGIGGVNKKSTFIRAEIYNKLNLYDLVYPVISSKSANISKKTLISDGVTIFNNVTIGPNVKVGLCSILNNNCLIEHGVSIGRFCHISTGAIINGNSFIGDYSFIGSGAIIKNGLKVGKNCYIGMGEILTIDLPDDTIFINGKDSKLIK
jgi:sugar O-acyltransferase (sialic acid O-acetyltransferase NeuD family)